ncbi:MAG: Clp protease ClpP [Clostridia bacterium]|nr:Clp protease ClpP [Clostridia bacterium]
MKTKFWNWIHNDDVGERALFLEGVIAEESWFEDDVTPALFKSELNAGSGPIILHINSPGGDCIAASQIYTMLMDYPHDVKVQIDGVAASAASVIAMAGTHVSMSPTALMMIHNPFTLALGDSEEMRKAIQLLDEVKESIINAYEIKTGLSRTRLSHMMDAETWMNAKMAKELGFCDEVLYQPDKMDQPENSFTFSRRAVTNCLLGKMKAAIPEHPPDTPFETPPDPPPEPVPENDPVPEANKRVNASDLEKRLARFLYL